VTFAAGTAAGTVFSFKVGFAVQETGGPQVVDGQVTGDVPIELVATSESADNVYSGLINMVDMTASDEDVLGFVTDGGEDTLLQELNETNGKGPPVTIGVKLKTKPLAEVILTLTVPLETGDTSPQIAFANGTVLPTFNAGNWNVYQYINVSAIDDLDVESLHSATIRFTASSGGVATTTGTSPNSAIWDPFYAGYTEDRNLLIEAGGFLRTITPPTLCPVTYSPRTCVCIGRERDAFACIKRQQSVFAMAPDYY